MHLDYANFAREAEEFDARPAGSLLLPPLPWYKRPEFWAIIIGTFSLTHGFFIQWIWPKIKQHLTEESPYSPRRICEEEL
jgi:hypothetical protein